MAKINFLVEGGHHIQKCQSSIETCLQQPLSVLSYHTAFCAMFDTCTCVHVH